MSANTAITDSNGEASVTITSNNAGLATVSATALDQVGKKISVEQQIEFVATNPTMMYLQASSYTVNKNGQSTITAIVRDANKNLVKGKIVTFSLYDTTGGTLSIPQAVTDSLGRAQTVYTASNSSSAKDGVVIVANVLSTSVQATTNITVAGEALFISLGTGNTVNEPDASTYSVPYTILVTDAEGMGVNNLPLTVSVVSVEYAVGQRDPSIYR